MSFPRFWIVIGLAVLSFGSTAQVGHPSNPPADRPLVTDGACPVAAACAARIAPSGQALQVAAKDCSQAPNCSDGCYCQYDNCSSGCGDGDAACVNRCLKSLWSCIDCCNGKC